MPTHKLEELAYVRPDENLFDHLSSGADFDFGDTPAADTGGSGFFNNLDPSILGIPAGGLEMDVGFGEGDFQSPFHTPQSFNQAAQSYLSHTKKRRGSKALENITEEDFDEGPERYAYLVILRNANKLLLKNTSKKQFDEGLHYFFTDHDAGDLTFPLCCDVLQAKPDVFRLRLQYEWFKRGTLFTGPFPFDSVGSPRIMEGELLFHGGRLGYALAREMWVQPGISTEELLLVVGQTYPSFESTVPEHNNQRMRSTLEQLQDTYIISKNLGWYFTGRNPMLMNMKSASVFGSEHSIGGTVHWARLFS